MSRHETTHRDPSTPRACAECGGRRRPLEPYAAKALDWRLDRDKTIHLCDHCYARPDAAWRSRWRTRRIDRVA